MMKTIVATVSRALGFGRASETSMYVIRQTVDSLSAIERPAAALVCLERFAQHFGIEQPALTAFIEHLWGVVHVTPETWVAWAGAFDDMVMLKSVEEYPPALAGSIPAAVRRDLSVLTRAVFETTAATWYCSNPEGTRDALLEVVEMLRKHDIAVPDLTLFRLSPGNCGDAWGPRPSDGVIASWKALGKPNNALQTTCEDARA